MPCEPGEAWHTGKGTTWVLQSTLTYDGKVIVPDEPLDLPPNQPLVVRIESISRAGLADESALTWIAGNSCDSPQLPSDLSHQHDHYLYGVPKKDLPATGP